MYFYLLYLDRTKNFKKALDSDEIKEIKNCILNALVGGSENVVFVVLKENYTPDELTFRRLRGKDKDMVSLFKNCPFVDVHLAVVNHRWKEIQIKDKACKDCDFSSSMCTKCLLESSNDKNTSRSSSYTISKWIDSQDTFVNLNIEVNWEKQCVGPNIESLSKERKNPDQNVEVFKTEQSDGTFLIRKHIYYRHAVLFIWPKRQSYQIYCRFGIHSLVNRWEKTLITCSKAPVPEQSEAKKEIASELMAIITLCGDKDLRSWSKNIMSKQKITSRLLRLCIDLKAKKEGLALLKVLGTKFNTAANSLVDIEGIADENVAQSIAKFENEVVGMQNTKLKLLFKRDKE